MTTFAAIFGALPMAMGFGADGSSRQPMGLCIVGGLIVAQILTLFCTPVFYVYMEYFQERYLDKIAFFKRGRRRASRICEDPWLPKAKLSARQGWEALYPVAGEYAVSCEPSLLHLERIGDVGKGTWNRLFVEGLEIVNFEDHARLD